MPATVGFDMACANMIGAGLVRKALAAWGRVSGAPPEVGDLNFFFAAPSVGGSERVHAAIVAAVADQTPCVFFTEHGRDAALLGDFQAHARVFDFAPAVQSRYGFYTCLGRVAQAINRLPAPVVVGAYSFFFIRLVGRLAPHVRCIDIVHNFGTKYERGSLECARRLDARVAVNHQTKADIAALYREHGLSEDLNARVRVIENCCAVPATPPLKPTGTLKVLFVSRGAPEKRAHLFGKLATLCKRRGVDARFTLAGDLHAWVRDEDKPACEFLGKVTDPAAMAALYAASHALVLTSEREGFPLVVMEAMAQACVPLCSDVGGIRERVRHGANGMLFQAADETQLVEEMAAALAELVNDRKRLEALSAAAFDTANKHFREERFRAEYRELLLGIGPQNATC